jgi:hypothetical protein
LNIFTIYKNFNSVILDVLPLESKTYNHIAFIYERISLLLGPSYRNSKNAFLGNIKGGDKVLYMAGGTGVNLAEILERVGKTGRVIYVEASSQMIELAKKRIPPNLDSQIQYLHQSDFGQLPMEKYDFVLTQYFLDILPDKEISRLFEALELRTERNSKWIFVDFFEVKGKRWLLGLMISFFQIFTGNPRKDLPKYSRHFSFYGWKITQEQTFDRGFIQAWQLEKRSAKKIKNINERGVSQVLDCKLSKVIHQD